MKDVIIKKFDDGYLACLISKNLYFFDDIGICIKEIILIMVK